MKNKTIILLVFILFHLLVGVACACGRFPISDEKSERTEEPVVVVPEPIIQEQPPVEEIPPAEEIQPVEPEEALSNQVRNC